MIKDMPKNEGGTPEKKQYKNSTPTKTEGVEVPTYQDLNISYKAASRCQQIAENNKEIQNRIAEFSKELPKATAGKPYHKSYSPHDGENKESKASILKDAGITHVERYEAIASLPEEAFEKHIAEVKLL